MSTRAAFLPDRLRPVTHLHGVRRSRRSHVLGALLVPIPALLLFLLLPAWRLETITVSGADTMPEAVLATAESLRGAPLVTINLGWIRQRLEAWPAVSAVDVRLDLPSTLQVTIVPATACASTPAGRGWHGVSSDGRLTGPLPEALAPRLIGLGVHPDAMRRGLAVARRLEQGSGGRVAAVRQILPGDYLVHLQAAGRTVEVLAAADATAAERHWCQSMTTAASWVDLRGQTRIVVAAHDDRLTPVGPGEPPPEAGHV